MHQKEGNTSSISGLRNKQIVQLTSYNDLELEIGTFLEFYRSLPKSTKLEMLPYIQALAKEYLKDQRLQQFTLFNHQWSYNSSEYGQTGRNVFKMMLKLLSLNKLSAKFLKSDQQLIKLKISINRQINQNTFNPINAIHPKFEYYYKMSRELDENGHGFNHQKPTDSDFYAPPRLFIRLQERKHFKATQDLKGNILLLTVEGNSIVGRNGFAVTNRNSVQWWQKIDENFISNIIDEQKPQQKEIKNQKEKTKQNYQNQKLQLKYKITGHHGKITSVSVSYDQLYMLTAATDNVVKLWCLRSKMQLTEYKCHIKTIWSVCFCQSGYFFLTGSADFLIKMWKTDQPYAIRILSGHQSDVLKVGFMRNPDMAISSSDDGSIMIWNILQAQCLQKFHFNAPVFNFSISFSGRYIAASSAKGVITLFDLVKGVKLNNFSISNTDIKKSNSQLISNGLEKDYNQLVIHDMCFSDNDRQFACISGKYIIMYSMDTLSEKMASNIFSLFGEKEENSINHKLNPTEVIHIGRDMNLFYCRYHPKNYLIVGGSIKKY